MTQQNQSPVVTDEATKSIVDWVCDDVLPAYGIESEASRNDVELFASARAALEFAYNVDLASHRQYGPYDALIAIAKRILERGYISQSIEEERNDHLALVAALEAALPSGVRAKPLEWISPEQGRLKAVTPWGTFLICDQPMFGKPWRSFSPSGWPTHSGENAEEVRQKIEADYERRILSALEGEGHE